MHILIIPSEQYVPGTMEGIFQQHQAAALRRAGYAVGVLSVELKSMRVLHQQARDRSTGITVIYDGDIPVLKGNGWQWIPYLFHGQLWLLVRKGIALFKEYVARYGLPDLIHAHNALPSGIIAEQIAKVWGIPYLITEHSTTYARNLVNPAAKPYIRSAFAAAKRRIVVSPSLGAVLERVIGASVRPWMYVPNILDNSFQGISSPQSQTKKNGLICTLLNVATLDSKKGHADLLHAFAELVRAGEQMELRIGGDGVLRSELETLSRQLGIAAHVYFLGELNRSQVLQEMQACDIYVQPSHYETFGVVLIEALACGKPVVATACGGPEHIVTPFNGILVQVGDIVGLSDAIVRIRKNLTNFDAIQIRESCLAQYGEASIVRTWSQLYREVLQEQDGSRVIQQQGQFV